MSLSWPKNSPLLMEPRSSLPFSQGPATVQPNLSYVLCHLVKDL